MNCGASHLPSTSCSTYRLQLPSGSPQLPGFGSGCEHAVGDEVDDRAVFAGTHDGSAHGGVFAGVRGHAQVGDAVSRRLFRFEHVQVRFRGVFPGPRGAREARRVGEEHLRAVRVRGLEQRVQERVFGRGHAFTEFIDLQRFFLLDLPHVEVRIPFACLCSPFCALVPLDTVSVVRDCGDHHVVARVAFLFVAAAEPGLFGGGRTAGQDRYERELAFGPLVETVFRSFRLQFVEVRLDDHILVVRAWRP